MRLNFGGGGGVGQFVCGLRNKLFGHETGFPNSETVQAQFCLFPTQNDLAAWPSIAYMNV